MLLDNVVFTRGAAAHLPDNPLIAFYDTLERKGGDAIILCRHHTAVISLALIPFDTFCSSILPYQTFYFLVGRQNHQVTPPAQGGAEGSV